MPTWRIHRWLSPTAAFAVVAAIFIVIPVVRAQEPPIVRAAVGVLPPFVVKEDNQLTGFSVDLWNEIATRLAIKTTYQEVSDVDELLNALRTKQADIVATGLFYTAERDREFEYSYPILEAGLQVMVRDGGGQLGPAPLADVLDLLFSFNALVWLAVALLIVILPAHIFWLLDRGNEEGSSPDRRYFPGILHSATWAITALVSQVQTLPTQWLARILGLVWMFAGVVFIAMYTAELTASLTVQRIQGAINGPGDLPGKNVAAIAESTAAAYLRNIGAQVFEFSTPDQMYQALLDKKVDAILGTAPALRYFVAQDGSGQFDLVGPEFDRNDIGFLFPSNDPLRRHVNTAIIAIHEDGTYQKIYQKWFGDD
ncbi:MAG: transporter substrate-binding domain-containing protein [Hyphomicrobiales bacterium]